MAGLPLTLDPQLLRRELGLSGAVMIGLGSMIGTGVFVSIGLAAGVAGSGIVAAIALAALVATCNGLSSAQLAARMPLSGGTYEYGYALLRPWLGFAAGWLFLCAKTASAATAALGFSGYLLTAAHIGGQRILVALALVPVALSTLLALAGSRRSSAVNIVIVTTTLTSLAALILAGAPTALAAGAQFAALPSSASDLLHAAALMFVAFTGYGRIATLGEEVRAPERTIPRAIVITLLVSAVLYIGVGAVGVAVIGAPEMDLAARQQAAPLAVVARRLNVPGLEMLVVIGAITAMLGVLLNLLLGLSRVLLAMGRRGDMPRATARLNAKRTTPYVAVGVVGLAVASLVLLGNIRTTWSFSAFTVLIYYAITNLAALRLPAEQRLYSPWIARIGLAGCLVLAFWVEKEIWLAGLGIIAADLVWHTAMQRFGKAS